MLYIPLLLQLFGCPNPPDPNQANSPTGGTNNAGGPNNQPAGSPPNGQNNPPPTDGDTPKAPGKVEGGEGGGGGAPPPGQPGLGGLPPIDGNIIQESVIVHIVNESPEESPARFTQEQLKEVEHVTLSGTIECSGDGCDSAMVLRVIPFVSPDAEGDRDIEFDTHVTQKSISTLGAYEILLPKSDTPVVFELLVDINEDGIPSKGDRMAVLEKGGQLIPNSNLNGLNLNTTDQEEIGPLGGPAAPQNPMEAPPPPDKQGEEGPPPGEGEGEGEGPPPGEGEGPPPGEGEGPPPGEGEGPPPGEGGEPGPQ